MAAKGGERHNFSGGDDNSTVLDFSSPPTSLVMPQAAIQGEIVAQHDHIALHGGGGGSNKRVVVTKTKDKPLFVRGVFHRGFHFLDHNTRLSARVESILGTTTIKFLQNLMNKLPNNTSDLHLLNGMMFSFFNLSRKHAHKWSHEEDEMLDAITMKGSKIMVHKTFLPSILNGTKVNSRLISRDALALPPSLVKQFKPDIFKSRKHMTAEIFFKVLMIVFIVRVIQRVHAYLKLTGRRTVTEALLAAIKLNGVFVAPIPSQTTQAKWVEKHPSLIVKPKARASGAPAPVSAPSVIVVAPPSSKKRTRSTTKAANVRPSKRTRRSKRNKKTSS